MLGKGGGGGTTTQKTELDPLQRKMLGSLLTKSEAQYRNPVEFFPGQTLADQDYWTQAGQRNLLDATVGMRNTMGEAEDAWGRALNADVAGDPRTLALADAATQPLQDQFAEQVLPAISSGASAAGAFGGTRQGLQTAAAGREFTRAVGETRANVLGDAYRAGLQQQTAALGMLPMMNQQRLLPGQVMQGVGAQREARGQAEIDADRERFEFEQFEPESRLDRFASRVAGINLGGITSATSRSSGGGLFGK